MISSLSFVGNVVTRGSAHRKFIELPKLIRDYIPKGNYSITLAALGTVEPVQAYPTE